MNFVVNADDFGMTKNCTDATIMAYEKGLIQTATIVANGACFSYALEEAGKAGMKDVIGIHLNLTSGSPLTESVRESKAFCHEDGSFHGQIKPFYSKKERQLILEELSAQVERLLGEGITIHHLDSHHHIHNMPGILPIVLKICDTYKIDRVRALRNIGSISLYKYLYKSIVNRFVIGPRAYTKWFGSFRDVRQGKLSGRCDEQFICEIMCHPYLNEENTLMDRVRFDSEDSMQAGIPMEEQVDYVRRKQL